MMMGPNKLIYNNTMRLVLNRYCFTSSKVWNQASYQKPEEKSVPIPIGINDVTSIGINDVTTPLKIRVKKATKYMGSSQAISLYIYTGGPFYKH